MKLANKLNLILIFVLFISILINGAILANILQKRAHLEVTDKVNALSEIMNAIVSFPYKISYTPNTKYKWDKDINEFTAIETEYVFIDFANLQSIFNNLPENSHSQDYKYKLLTLNPIDSQVNKFDKQLFEQFTKKPANTYSSGFYTFGEEESFYIARCVTDYKHEKPFCLIGNKNNIFVNIIYIPASKTFAATRQFWLLTMIRLFAISAIVMIVINLLLKRIIIKPIVQISKFARVVSTNKAYDDVYLPEGSKDEIGSLAASFNRMINSLKISEKLRKEQKDNN